MTWTDSHYYLSLTLLQRKGKGNARARAMQGQGPRVAQGQSEGNSMAYIQMGMKTLQAEQHITPMETQSGPMKKR
jgi:hypothetical protein